jgi:hypothetical protein
VKSVERRGREVAYIEATLSDIEVANRLAHEALGRSLDELPPQTRRLLLVIDAAVRRECERLKMERSDFRFSRRNVRAWSEWGDTVLKKHLGRLEDMEYLLAHRGGRGQSFVYELLFDGQGADGKPWLPGLIDVERLRYDGKKSPSKEEMSRPNRPQVAGVSWGSRPAETRMNTGANAYSASIRPGGINTGFDENRIVAAAAGAGQ